MNTATTMNFASNRSEWKKMIGILYFLVLSTFLFATDPPNSLLETTTLNCPEDTIPPVIGPIPADITLDCDDPIPDYDVTVTDNCPGATIFLSHVITSRECDPGLEMWVPCDGQGADATGLHTCELINGGNFGAGLVGEGFVFDGQDDVLVIDKSLDIGGGEYSVSNWINTSDPGTQVLFAAVDPSTNNPGILVEVNASGKVSYLHRAPASNSGGTLITGTTKVNDGEWHHVVVTKTATETILIIDGVQEASAPNETVFNSPLEVFFAGHPVAFGNENFGGTMDEFRIYTRAICDEEAQALFNAGNIGTWGTAYRMINQWDAFDAAGNFSTKSQVIIVNDLSKPTLTVPSPLTIECSGPDGVSNTSTEILDWLNSATANDNCSCVSLTWGLDPTFPSACAPGSSTEVAFAATDACGNVATGVSTITVIDSRPPTITCPEDINVMGAAGGGGATVAFSVGSDDLCGSPVTVTSSAASGSTFPTGATTVTSTATDACGNAATCSFTIHVEGGGDPLEVTACGTQNVAPAYGPEARAKLRVFVSGGTPPLTYKWSTGATTANIRVRPTTSQVYTVTVTDANGNTASTEMSVNVIDVTCMSVGGSASSRGSGSRSGHSSGSHSRSGNGKNGKGGGNRGKGGGKGKHKSGSRSGSGGSGMAETSIQLCFSGKEGRPPKTRCVSKSKVRERLLKPGWSFGPCGVDFGGGDCGECPGS